jgi:hypothetical protein
VPRSQYFRLSAWRSVLSTQTLSKRRSEPLCTRYGEPRGINAAMFENGLARVRTSNEVLRTTCLTVRDRPIPDGQVVSEIFYKVDVSA